MESAFLAIAEFAKENGVGATIPLAMYVVYKAVKEDFKERIGKIDKNLDRIHQLEVDVASIKATLEAIISKNY